MLARCARGVATATAFATLTIALGAPTPASATAPPAAPGCASTTTTFTNIPAVPIDIPASGTPTVSLSTVVAGIGPYLRDVDLETYINHVRTTDLDITLQSPAGTVVTISSDNGGGPYLLFQGTTWDDDANPGGQVPYTSNPGLVTDADFSSTSTALELAPEEPLGAFVGENPNGTWTLTVSDDTDGMGGDINGMRLRLTTLPTAPTSTTSTFSTSTPVSLPATGGPLEVSSTVNVAKFGANVLDVDLTTSLRHTGNGQLQMSLTSPAGTVVTLSTNNGGTFDDVFAGTDWNDDANPGGQVPQASNPGLVTDRAVTSNGLASPLAPEEPLAAFIGENPSGPWTIRVVRPTASADSGSLDDWSLDLVTGGCPPQPDARIARGTGALAGNNVYNATGAAQSQNGTAPRGGSVTYVVSAQNDAQIADRLTLRGQGSTTAFRVRYLNPAGEDITGPVNAGAFRTPPLAAGETYRVRAVVTVNAAAAPGATLGRKVTATSDADASRADTVKFTTTRS